MRKLSDQEIEQIASLLKEGKPLSEDYKTVLFDAKKEYELAYANKEREEDILSDTMAVPLQPVKTFRNGEDGSGWTNMLIFGDNLQVLKTLLLMKQEGKLKSADGTPGVRLVYIDPPFATRQEFQGSQNQKAYQDKIAGANFLEFLRKRLVFLRELLSEDGSIYVHLDWKKVHYIKVLMDEIFGEYNFITEIIWNYGSPSGGRVGGSKLVRSHETLIGYAKHYGKHVYNQVYLPYSEKYINDWFKYEDEQGRRYRKRQRGRDKDGNIIWEKQYLDDSKGMPASTVWYDIQQIYADPRAYKADQAGKSELTGYPTQKPEKLLNRLIQMSSNPGDIILDCFAGSGTTLAVAERLGRRWIGVDCGKLAIYTIQKRLLNIAESKNLGDPQKKKKYGKPCRPFTLYNAGLYDYQMLKNLPWEQYREFALKLFQCRDEKHEISKIELDGYLGADGVLVFNYQKHKDVMLDRGFIDDLHRHLEERIGRRFFIIAPAASVRFLEDYIEKGSTKYFILRIPYSIIEEIHNRGFTKIKQPVSEMDINDTVDAVGFDFIQVPTVECKYFIDDKKGQQKLGEGTKECVIKIEKFESKVISRKPLEFANLETLSMVMLDYDFDGEVFDLDEVFYAEELKKNGYEVRFGKDKVKGQMMVIYMDIFGNERREIKTLSDFEGKRGK